MQVMERTNHVPREVVLTLKVEVFLSSEFIDKHSLEVVSEKVCVGGQVQLEMSGENTQRRKKTIIVNASHFQMAPLRECWGVLIRAHKIGKFQRWAFRPRDGTVCPSWTDAHFWEEGREFFSLKGGISKDRIGFSSAY